MIQRLGVQCEWIWVPGKWCSTKSVHSKWTREHSTMASQAIEKVNSSSVHENHYCSAVDKGCTGRHLLGGTYFLQMLSFTHSPHLRETLGHRFNTVFCFQQLGSHPRWGAPQRFLMLYWKNKSAFIWIVGETVENRNETVAGAAEVDGKCLN